MAERGAQPPVPWGRRLFLRAVRHLFGPLRPDDYLEMINPLWTTKELRGKVERVEAQGSEAASVLIRPGSEWAGHKPGQYVRLGVVIDGRYHWRAYSLTSDPAPQDDLISVTPKKVDSGVVSPYLVEKIQPGDVVRLGEDPDRLHFERFQPKISGDGGAGEGGKVSFLESEMTIECDGGTPILEAGEEAGLNLAYGCRIGICHTCVGTLKSGKLRYLRSGEVTEPTGQDVRICINTAEGDVELEL